MTDHAYDLVVVGGGAAGFFGAINAAELNSSLKILILERTNKLLSKVRVSGGGRCNITHRCFEPTPLSRHYPRGQKALKRSFTTFQASDTVQWFERRGVTLKAEKDGRMFPTTDNSQTIIDCFLREAHHHGIQIETKVDIVEVKRSKGLFQLTSASGNSYHSRKILIATGGSSRMNAYRWIEGLGHTIAKPIPSLFTFNDSEKRFVDLMGIAVEKAQVAIAGSSFSESGPVLLTHWGLSGPAVIKLSAWAAEYLHEVNYEFTVLVNWINGIKEHALRQELETYITESGKKAIVNHPLYNIPTRLWARLCELSEIGPTKIWAEVAKRQLNKLIENLTRSAFKIKGKTTFKEEFVICGGVSLQELELETMESKKMKGVYFAGEVLNVDGETGGFNFQSAWTTAFIASSHLAQG